MTKRQTKDWSAVDTSNIATGKHELHVHGIVETNDSSEVVELREITPQGINPAELMLSCIVTKKGAGADVKGWKDAVFVKPITEGQYTAVAISGPEIDAVRVNVSQGVG
jgi:hypothetical protein